MFKRIKEIFEFSAKQGLNLPSAYDADKKGPSVTLLFTHVANAVAIISIILLMIKDINLGTTAAIIYSVITMVLYMMRRVTKFKVDLDDKSIDLEGGDKNEKDS